MSTLIPIEHEIKAPWLAALVSGRQTEAAILVKVGNLKAALYDLKLRTDSLQATMSVLVGLVVEAEGLPKSETPYSLSPDGTKLIGSVVRAELEPDAQPEGRGEDAPEPHE